MDKSLKSESELLKAKMDKTTFHAEGGIAGMLGEPRSGYDDGGDTSSDFLIGGAQKRYENIMESPQEKLRKWKTQNSKTAKNWSKMKSYTRKCKKESI